MNLRRGLVVVVLLSSVVLTVGVDLERAAEPGVAETVLGISPESPVLILTAIVFTVILAAAIIVRPVLLVLDAAAAFGLAFAFLDTLEIVHQAQERRLHLAAVAGVAGLFHLAVTVLAVVLKRQPATGQGS